MVKKLIRYDFRSFFRLIFPAQLILIGIAGINRIVQLFEPAENDATYTSVFGSSVALFIVGCIALILLTLIVAMVRFYQGMYSNEGYLSHTLPVKPSQHIISKLLTAFLFELGSVLAIFISLNVITLGDVNIEVYKAIGYLVKELFGEYGVHSMLFIVEVILCALISMLTTVLMLYMCISIGQLAKKKKILLAVGVLFGLYVLGQMLGTVLIIIVATMDPNMLEAIEQWIENNMITFMHISFCGGFVLDAIAALIFFFVNRHIMAKKLNLT